MDPDSDLYLIYDATGYFLYIFVSIELFIYILFLYSDTANKRYIYIYIYWVLYKQTLEDVRSTGARIECP